MLGRLADHRIIRFVRSSVSTHRDLGGGEQIAPKELNGIFDRESGAEYLTTQPYGKRFYDTQSGGSALSASKVVPILVELLEPKSMLDIGCGVGPWCAEFARLGVTESYGVDGPWVDQTRFSLGPGHFTQFDFSSGQMPFNPPLKRARFDLVLTLEFLEHVSELRAQSVVDFMCDITDVVVIGAAIPGQGGTGHVNEQWADYWIRLMAVRGFMPFDFLRPLIWDDVEVESWYRQNTIGFFRNEPPLRVRLAAERKVVERLSSPPRLVHPDLFTTKADNRLWKLARRMVKHSLGRR